METETGDPNQLVQPLTHWCVRRVLENGEEIRYMMTNAPPQVYATRVVGQEVWKTEALLTEGGAVIGYTRRRRRVSLGLAMATVKDDDSRIDAS